MSDLEIKVLGSSQELSEVETLQALIWDAKDIVPAHLLKAAIEAGGLVIGAYKKEILRGFVFGFVGLHDYDGETGIKHSSHMLGVHPEFQNSGLGYKLKQAQWKVVRQQGLELVTWTFDPLDSKNAFLNVSKLGAVSKKFKKDYYGEMNDPFGAEIASDRLEVEWWLNSQRALMRLGERSEPLSFSHYEAGKTMVFNSVKWSEEDFPVPHQDQMDKIESAEEKPKLLMFQIPANFGMIHKTNTSLAKEWRQYTRIIFDLLFGNGYLLTDFVYQKETPEAGYYVFSHGDVKLG